MTKEERAQAVKEALALLKTRTNRNNDAQLLADVVKEVGEQFLEASYGHRVHKDVLDAELHAWGMPALFLLTLQVASSHNLAPTLFRLQALLFDPAAHIDGMEGVSRLLAPLAEEGMLQHLNVKDSYKAWLNHYKNVELIEALKKVYEANDPDTVAEDKKQVAAARRALVTEALVPCLQANMVMLQQKGENAIAQINDIQNTLMMLYREQTDLPFPSTFLEVLFATSCKVGRTVAVCAFYQDLMSLAQFKKVSVPAQTKGMLLKGITVALSASLPAYKEAALGILSSGEALFGKEFVQYYTTDHLYAALKHFPGAVEFFLEDGRMPAGFVKAPKKELLEYALKEKRYALVLQLSDAVWKNTRSSRCEDEINHSTMHTACMQVLKECDDAEMAMAAFKAWEMWGKYANDSKRSLNHLYADRLKEAMRVVKYDALRTVMREARWRYLEEKLTLEKTSDVSLLNTECTRIQYCTELKKQPEGVIEYAKIDIGRKWDTMLKVGVATVVVIAGALLAAPLGVPVLGATVYEAGVALVAMVGLHQWRAAYKDYRWERQYTANLENQITKFEKQISEATEKSKALESHIISIDSELANIQAERAAAISPATQPDVVQQTGTPVSPQAAAAAVSMDGKAPEIELK